VIGTVRKFIPARIEPDGHRSGFFGFISTEAGDFWYHGLSVSGAELPDRADEVSFDLEEDEQRGGRLVAVNVQLVK